MNKSQEKWILAIDPGSDKVGYAVILYNLECKDRGICYLSELNRIFKKFCTSEPLPEAVVVGGGTSSAIVSRLYNSLNYSPDLKFCDETNSTLKARERFFEENPPTGLWKLMPIGLQTPGRAIDDYAATIIGESYIKRFVKPKLTGD